MQQKSCFIYARQSSGKEEDSESIAMQLEKCRELARTQNYRILGEFSDANSSGRLYPAGAEALAAQDAIYQQWLVQQSSEKQSRRGLGKMFRELHKADVIVVDDLTRLARPLSGSFLNDYIKQQLLRSGSIIVHTVKNGPLDYANYMDCLVSDVQTHVVDNQLKIQTRKAKDALRKIKDSGYLPTGAKMFGIKYIGGTERKVEVIPECAAAIRFIFAEVAKETPLNEIVFAVNTRYRHLFKTICYKSTLRNILSQPFYAGMIYNSHGQLIPARQMHGQTVITPDEYFAARQRLHRTATGKAPRRYRDLPFSGLLFCGNCGARMVCGTDHGKIFYYCAAGSNALRQQSCRDSRINITLLRHHKRFSGFAEAVAPLLMLCLQQPQTPSARPALPELEKQAADQENLLSLLTENFLDHHIPLENMKHQISAIAASLKSLHAEIAMLKYATTPAPRDRQLNLTISALKQGSLPPEKFRSLLHQCIKTIHCFRDHVLIDTISGTCRLDRYMLPPYRNFPRWQMKSTSRTSRCFTLAYRNDTLPSPHRLPQQLGNITVM